MLKKLIFYEKLWFILIASVHIMGGNCRSTRSLPLPPATPPVEDTDTAKPSQQDLIQLNQTGGDRNSLHSNSSTSSRISTGSSDPDYSNGSDSSGTSSGYYSPGGSSGNGFSAAPPLSPSPPTPTDFAGLPNIGNSCFMNSGLQLIAAFYNGEVQKHKIDYLENFNNAINNGHYPLNPDTVQDFVFFFPEKAKTLATSGQQHDPDEFIMELGGRKFLHAISYDERLLFKSKERGQQTFLQKQLPNQVSYALRIGFNGEPDNSRQLNDMIVSSREELVDGEDIINSSNSYNLDTCTKSSFLEKNESRLTPQEKNDLKQYIKQQVFKKLPDKLYIQLKRYTADNKITDRVHGTMEITIQLDPNKQDTVAFDLHGFILHKGSTTTGGHYIAYVKRNGKWYEANDSSIKAIQPDVIQNISQEAYLLFYRKKQ